MKAQKSDPELSWYEVSNNEEINSPSLIIYPDRVESNIREMISVAGGTDAVRPHVKTHKMDEIVRLMMLYGINKFKCATVAEAEMIASCGAADVLLAIQPVGPNIDRFFELMEKFPNTKFSCITDSEDVMILIWQKGYQKRTETNLWVDINNGMNRTGIVPGEKANILYHTIAKLPMLNAEGLHVYDGHIHDRDPVIRKRKCDEAFESVSEMAANLRSSGLEVKIVAGGTPTFPFHAARMGVETSPGTVLLMDYGYSSAFSDLNFLNAAVLFTRIISKPAKNLLCIDLGHKAVASEMPHPRIKILGISDCSFISHNEEHMVLYTPEAEKFIPGDHLYCLPWHICPTVDRYDAVYTATGNRVTGQWDVSARKRKISV